MGPDRGGSREPFDGWIAVDRQDRVGGRFFEASSRRPVRDDVVKEGHRFMATFTPPAEVTEVVDPESLYRMPPRIYQRIVQRGVFRPSDRVVLVDGLLVQEDAPMPERLYRMPLEVYHAIAEHELLTPRDKVVLLDGLLVKKMNRGAPHVTVTQRVINALNTFGLVGWYPRMESPLTLPGKPGSRDSEPEPDVAVVRGHLEDYALRHPGPDEVAVVVEVIASSLRKDRKGLAMYAGAGIPTVWLVRLTDGSVEVHSQPTSAGDPAKYDVMKRYVRGDQIPVVIERREIGRIAVKEIFP
jgi:Uma2 family endonuclease